MNEWVSEWLSDEGIDRLEDGVIYVVLLVSRMKECYGV